MVKDMVQRSDANGSKRREAWSLAYTTGSSIAGSQIHEQGTCRMGNDPKQVCNESLGPMTHDVPNLILADGSLHCTSGITDPTLTILSLTMRNANHLIDEELRNGHV